MLTLNSEKRGGRGDCRDINDLYTHLNYIQFSMVWFGLVGLRARILILSVMFYIKNTYVPEFLFVFVHLQLLLCFNLRIQHLETHITVILWINFIITGFMRLQPSPTEQTEIKSKFMGAVLPNDNGGNGDEPIRMVLNG